MPARTFVASWFETRRKGDTPHHEGLVPRSMLHIDHEKSPHGDDQHLAAQRVLILRSPPQAGVSKDGRDHTARHASSIFRNSATKRRHP
ncbi:hypothetical protein BBta_4927 [Bradyrhizobium sp. BTAi1]|nr:hypothetical protein BBta_4927 [Bradyrhizobium sp. BTAi1]